MDSCECGDTGNDGNGDKGPEHCRNREKEQKTCQFVGRSVREAESFADYQRKDLIDKFNHNYSPRPYPQPSRNPDNWNYPDYRAIDRRPQEI